MRYFALLAVSLFAVAMFAPHSAQAVPTEPIVSIVSPTDGGLIPDAVTLTRQTNYDLQCKNPSCARFYRFDGGTQVATCTGVGSGFHLPTVNQSATASTNTVNQVSYKFQSAGLDRLRVAALDGGNPACNLYLDAINIR